MEWHNLKFSLPKKIKKPLVLFIIFSIIGIVIQSLKADNLVFIDFFWHNYIQTISMVYNTLNGAVMFGLFSLWLVGILEVFYYIVMTVCAIIIIYQLLVTFDEKNSQKIIIYLVIVITIIIVLNNYLPGTIVINGLNSCPVDIIPKEISLTDEFFAFSNYSEGGLEKINNYEDGHWADGTEMVLNTGSMGTLKSLCRGGSSEGENINYVYCNGLAYSKTTTPISPTGEIGKTNTVSYNINLVLENVSRRDILIRWVSPPDRISVQNHITTYKVISSNCHKV